MKALSAKQAVPIIVLTLVVLVAVSVLSFTYQLTKPAIEKQKWAKIESVLDELYPSITSYESHQDCEDICVVLSQDQIIGYAFLATGQGYGGDIEILVGLEDVSTVKGIVIISHSETPGLGARITESEFGDDFAGVTIDDLSLSGDGGAIDAVTGASISSLAVVTAVKDTAIDMLKLITGDASTPTVTSTPTAAPAVTATPTAAPGVTATPTATPAETAAPSAGPTDTPHAVDGMYENCLQCHQTTQLPPDHSAFASDNCLACHKPAG